MKEFLLLCVLCVIFSSCTAAIETDPLPIENIVVYHGITLNAEDREIDIDDESKAAAVERLSEKYGVELSYYKNGVNIGIGASDPEGRGLDYYWYLPMDGEIAFSGSYDPYPRSYEVVDNIPIIEKVQQDVKVRFDVEVKGVKCIEVDLDADGSAEYLVQLQSRDCHSVYICLVDNSGVVVSYLLASTNDANELDYDLEGDTEVIDIDNDGCMEIIVTMISYEGFIFNTYKYDQGVFSGGEFINSCSTAP